MSAGQIKKAIEIAVKNEDYELAAQLRDELNKKND
jgi:protein-arginine kinase activator protein McsA